MGIRNRLVAGVIGVLALPVIAACDDAPPPAPPKTAAAAKKPAVEAKVAGGSTETQIPVEYVYTPVGKRDPFRSFFEDSAPVSAVPTDPSCGPLCQFELDQLRLVAVVSGVASPLAMVEDPQGRGHMVRRGSFIGKRSGKVSDIRRDKIVVTELLRNKQGQIIPAKTEMPLRGDKGSGKSSAADEVVDLSMAEGR